MGALDRLLSVLVQTRRPTICASVLYTVLRLLCRRTQINKHFNDRLLFQCYCVFKISRACQRDGVYLLEPNRITVVKEHISDASNSK